MRRAFLIATALLTVLLAGQAGFAAAPAAPATPAPAASDPAAAKLPAGFDAGAFRKNFVAGLAGRPHAPALKAEDVRVDSAEKAATFGGEDVYMVKGMLEPEGGQPQPFSLFISADGKFYVSDIVDLSVGKSLFQTARENARKADMTGFGHTVLHGQGATDIVFVSDPFCPFCRQAFSYLMGKSAFYGEFRLAHFPLAGHIGADIACSIMTWAEENDAEHLGDYARFAYEKLPVPRVADRSPKSLTKARVEVAAAFLKSFPKLKALGADGAAIVKALHDSPYAARVAADIARATGMDINGTPIIFVGKTRVEGFDKDRLDSLLK